MGANVERPMPKLSSRDSRHTVVHNKLICTSNSTADIIRILLACRVAPFSTDPTDAAARISRKNNATMHDSGATTSSFGHKRVTGIMG